MPFTYFAICSNKKKKKNTRNWEKAGSHGEEDRPLSLDFSLHYSGLRLLRVRLSQAPGYNEHFILFETSTFN